MKPTHNIVVGESYEKKRRTKNTLDKHWRVDDW